MVPKISFSKTTIGGQEIKAAVKVLKSGWVVQGPRVEEFEKAFAEYIGAPFCVFVNSCTNALFLALQWLNVTGKTREQQMVAVPSLTFVATAESVVNAGLTPIFVDVNEDMLMEGNYIGIVIPVHLMGNKSTAKGTVATIEDSAHRIVRKGFTGNTQCYSLYATKNMTCVQGGIIATPDPKEYAFYKAARDHGITKGTHERYAKGGWKYSIEMVGWHLKNTDLNAAIGLVQLKRLDRMNELRDKIVGRYNRNFGLSRRGNHLYPLIVENRDAFIENMKKDGIQVSVHFLPLHKMPAYKDFEHGDMTRTDYFGERLVSLPLWPGMTTQQVDYISKRAIQHVRTI